MNDPQSIEGIYYNEEKERIFIRWRDVTGQTVSSETIRGNKLLARMLADACGAALVRGNPGMPAESGMDTDQMAGRLREKGYLVLHKGRLDPERRVNLSGETHSEDCDDEDCDCGQCKLFLPSANCAMYEISNDGCSGCPHHYE